MATIALPREGGSTLWMVRDIIVPILLTRFVLTLIGFVAINTMPANMQVGQLAALPVHHAWLNAWARWDAAWYLSVARDGYYYNTVGQSSVAFFPMFPMLAKLGGMLIGGGDTGLVLSGVVVSNLFLVAAMAGLWKLVEMDFGAPAARRAVTYALIAPTTLFLSAMYPMSLFLALATGAFYFARRRQWAAAIALAALAPLARPDGVLLAGGLALEYLAQRHYRWREALAGMLCVMLPAAMTLGAWMAYLGYRFGDALAFVHAQRGWTSMPVGFRLDDWERFWGTLVLAACGVLLLVGWVRLRTSYVAWATAMWMLMASAGRCSSLPRFCVVLFPVYMVLALLGSSERFDRWWTITSTLLAGFLLVRYSLCYFVG